MNEPVLLTAKELAAILKVTPRTIRNYTRDGKVRSVKIGGIRRYLVPEIVENQHTTQP